MAASNRPGLTRQTLIDTALRLLNEVGLDGLTVRRLATELGVQSPALYWHIRTKQELLDEIADAIVQAPGMGPPDPGESWQDWLTRRARAYRQSLLAHRDGARIVANAQGLSTRTIQALNAELGGLVAYGFTPVLALRTITAVTNYATGFVLREQTDRPPRTPDAWLEGLPGLLSGDASAPLLVALRDGGSPVGDEAFEYGLRLLIAGTSATLAP
ncbi:TetR/AcrR family tetracycline transcriptional repressor [Hamadaea flava]|uniref:TetR/AcrR family transcriptional regulator C-terminal domain-containing protein n=1 Tax=Hamadaea flava TaxID=1742688 RepID=A0ABV8LX26_9ACTN|nr:TetR/AcrR family transcriptional regulator C-terminal domain-containing protein [Hamadaea flava]MCP2324736.1 TetR/AcrR family tetracycline transcriptional repressor [Hamadaea flava]